jgi:hypothetical protein
MRARIRSAQQRLERGVPVRPAEGCAADRVPRSPGSAGREGGDAHRGVHRRHVAPQAAVRRLRPYSAMERMACSG